MLVRGKSKKFRARNARKQVVYIWNLIRLAMAVSTPLPYPSRIGTPSNTMFLGPQAAPRSIQQFFAGCRRDRLTHTMLRDQ